ncbi:MAG: hypothetical protein Q8N15_03645, partial [Bacillota bacterium]|nr:hypothetical protein [Bacillota bacterium]
MSRRILKTLFLAALIGSLWACAAGLTAVSSLNAFSFTAGNDVSFTVDFQGGEFAWLEGHDIATGDYVIEADVITLKASYLSTLAPGTYAFTAASTAGNATLSVVVLDEQNQNRIYNGGFETGDLSGWTAQTTFKGEDALLAFVPEAVLENTAIPGLLIPFGGAGDYVYGFTGTGTDAWTEKTGIL